MIGIVDYGMGNLRSVFNALDYLGADVRICKSPEELKDIDRLVLPGVGAFRDCIENLTSQGFIEALNESVHQRGVPIIGICLGMQAMARRSTEGGEQTGLGWFDAEVIRLEPDDRSLRVPQIGWNEVKYRQGSLLFAHLPPAPDFYFVHSYYMKCNNEEDLDGVCEYGGITIAAAICKDNIFATQFHPEKSQDHGLGLLQNFLGWNP
jgi:glutamine amidotransferase